MPYSQKVTSGFWKIIDFNYTYREIIAYRLMALQIERWEDDDGA